MEIKTHVLTNPQNLSEERKLQARKNIDLGNVDNTSDMDKPVSTAQQAAIDALGTTVDGKLAGKVDKEAGKGLSTNDFDDTYKSKVEASYEVHHTHTNKSELDQITGNAIASAETTDEGKTLVLHPIEGEAVTFSGEQNAINTISQNGVTLPIVNKNVEITETIKSISVNTRPLDPDANHNVDITIESPVTPYEETPEMNGTGSAGSSSLYSRGDHVHPSDTTKADKDSDAVEGNLAKFDGNGNPVDTNVAASELSKLHSHSNQEILDATTAAYTTAKDTKLSGISEGATKVEASQTNGNIKINNVETTVYAHPTTVAVAASGVQVGRDANGHVVFGNQLTKSDINGIENVDNTSDADKPISTATQAALDNKVDKEEGKGLSTNDFTNDYKTKLDGIEAGAQVNLIEHIKVNNIEQTPSEKTVNLDLTGYKTVQEAVGDPSAEGTGTDFISSLTQSSNGNITASKKTVQDGTTAQKGIVQLEDSVISDSTDKAATPHSVKQAYTLADGKQDPITFDGTYNASTNKAATVSTVTNAINDLDSEVTSSNGKNVQVKVTETNGKITEVSVTTDNTLNESDILSKANKVNPAVAGNFAGLSANGDLTDSGKKAADFATAAQGATADTAVQGILLNGVELDKGVDDKKVNLGNLKVKQNAVSDPVTSGNTNDFQFISGITQNENGEMSATKHTIPVAVATDAQGQTNGLMSKDDKKKLNGIAEGAEVNKIEKVKIAGSELTIDSADRSVNIPDAATNVKGVVKLTSDIDSEDNNSAITPTAVRNALKSRAVFWSESDWEDHAPNPGDPSKVNYVYDSDNPGEDKYNVYVWDVNANSYKKIDESTISLDGYWHNGPTETGVAGGNVVTDLTLGNDGVPVVTKGTLGDGTLTVTVGSANAQTFSANQTSNVSVTVPLAQSASENPDTHQPIPASEGLISASDKSKLDSMTAGAQPNVIESVGMEGESSNLPVVDKHVEIPLAASATTSPAAAAKTGLMSGVDKARLDGMTDGAEPNTIDSISVNGTAVQPDGNKNVDLTIGDATVTFALGGVASGDTSPSVGSFSTNQVANATITIPAAVSATTDGNTPVPAKPGVMSSADKTTLDNVANAVKDITLEGQSDPLTVTNNAVEIPLASADDDGEGSVTYSPGLVTGQEREKIQNLVNFSNIAVSDGESTPTITNVVPSTAADTLTLVAGNNVTLTPDVNSNSITISSSGSGSDVTVSGSDGISVTETVDPNTGVKDFNVSVTGGLGIVSGHASVINPEAVAPSTTAVVDLIPSSAIGSFNVPNDRIKLMYDEDTGHVYLCALKTIASVNPSDAVHGVDTFTISMNTRLDRNPTRHGFYGEALTQVSRVLDGSTQILAQAFESYPSEIGCATMNLTVTIQNTSGLAYRDPVSNKLYYRYLLTYSGDAADTTVESMSLYTLLSAVEETVGIAEYSNSSTTYTSGSGIFISPTDNSISVLDGPGLEVDSSTNQLQVKIKPNGGIKIDNDGVSLVLDVQAEEAVEIAHEVKSVIDERIITDMSFSEIHEAYTSNQHFPARDGDGQIYGTLFTPVMSQQLTAGAKMGIYMGELSSQGRFALAIYQYDFTSDLTLVCYTDVMTCDPSSIPPASSTVSAFREFTVHINDACDTLSSDKLYYACVVLLKDSGGNEPVLKQMCGTSGYNTNINGVPRLTIAVNHLQNFCGGNINNLDTQSFKNYLSTISATAGSEQASTPRIFISVRNISTESNNE